MWIDINWFYSTLRKSKIWIYKTEGKINQSVLNFLKHYYFRSSHLRCSLKKVFLEISQNSQENICARDYFLIKLQAYFIKKESVAQVFSCEFCEISKNTFFQNTSGRLLLLFPHKTAYFFNNSLNAYKNADENSKFI